MNEANEAATSKIKEKTRKRENAKEPLFFYKSHVKLDFNPNIGFENMAPIYLHGVALQAKTKSDFYRVFCSGAKSAYILHTCTYSLLSTVQYSTISPVCMSARTCMCACTVLPVFPSVEYEPCSTFYSPIQITDPREVSACQHSYYVWYLRHADKPQTQSGSSF